MANDPHTQPSGNTGLAFVVGALVVVVGVLAYILFGGSIGDSSDVTISVEGAGEAVQDAANAIEGAAEGN